MSLIPLTLIARVQKACAGAIEVWGQEPQFRQAQEELCELSSAINRMIRRRPEGWAQTVEETVDVILCAYQLRIMLGAEVDVMIEKKLARLEDRVAKARALHDEPIQVVRAPCAGCRWDAPTGTLHEKGCYLA